MSTGFKAFDRVSTMDVFEEVKSLHIALRNKHIELQDKYNTLREKMIDFGDRLESYESETLVDPTLREERIAGREKAIEVIDKEVQLCHMNVLIEDLLIENLTLKSELHLTKGTSV